MEAVEEEEALETWVVVLPVPVTMPDGVRMHRHQYCHLVAQCVEVRVVVAQKSMHLGVQTDL